MIESKDATALIKAVKESGNFHTIVIACVVITVLYLVVVSLTVRSEATKLAKAGKWHGKSRLRDCRGSGIDDWQALGVEAFAA